MNEKQLIMFNLIITAVCIAIVIGLFVVIS